MPAVNPSNLLWARETAGLSLREAAKRIAIGGARGLDAAARLAAMEVGDEEPTRAMLVRMSKQYRRPLLAFYLSKPPGRGDRGTDFRTLPASESAETDPKVDALLRDVVCRQRMVRAALEAEGEAKRLPFIGSKRMSEGTGAVLEALGQALGDNLDVSAYYARPSALKAFALLRERAESAGVFVLLKGDLGNYVTALGADVFRGFALADPVAPFVVINDRDAKSAWSFTPDPARWPDLSGLPA